MLRVSRKDAAPLHPFMQKNWLYAINLQFISSIPNPKGDQDGNSFIAMDWSQLLFWPTWHRDCIFVLRR